MLKLKFDEEAAEGHLKETQQVNETQDTRSLY